MSETRGWELTVSLRAPVVRDEVPTLCGDAALILAHTRARVIRCDVGRVTGPDLSTLEAVSRLALTARRYGATVELFGACPTLRDVIELAGLADVIRVSTRSGVEVRGESEERKEGLGVEEEVEPDDLVP